MLLSLVTSFVGCKDGRYNLKITYTSASSGRYASLALSAYIILVAVVSRPFVFYLFFLYIHTVLIFPQGEVNFVS